MGAAAYTSPSYECLSDACRVSAARATPPPPPPPVSAKGSVDHDLVSTALDGVVFPHSVRSPFADAVEEALARKQAMLERRSERMRGLQDWRRYSNTTLASGNSRLLSTLATFSVYVYSGFQLRQPGIHTLRLAMLLFAMDVVGRFWIRWYWINVAEPCCRSASARLSGNVFLPWSGWGLKDTLYREIGVNGIKFASIAGFLQRSINSLSQITGCFLSRHSDFHSKTGTSPTPSQIQSQSLEVSESASAWCFLLPVHVLSIFLLACFREAAFAVHNMRVWYRTVVRDRRRGPAIVSGKSAALSTRGVSVATGSSDAAALLSDCSIATSQDNMNHVAAAGQGKLQRPAQGSSTVRSVLSSAGASGVYAHRICFLCLSGYCERCLLSMEIWPTALASSRQSVSSSSASAAGPSDSAGISNGCNEGSNYSGNSGYYGRSSGAAHVSVGSASISGSSSVTGSAKRKARGHGHGSSFARHQQNKTPIVCDPLLEESDNGLPSLRDSLLNLGLLNPSLNEPASSGSSFGMVQLNAGGAASGKRGKALDAWIVSSVAHCPCRAVHGVGPSSFVSKAIRAERTEQLCKQISTGCFEPPVGTLLPLAQYVRELKSLGLVRPVDPSSVVSNEDPTASVFPMIFGRFTMPENPQAVAAANALLASSAASYAQLTQPSGHTPGGAPFLGAPSSSSASSTSSSSASAISDGFNRPSRILVKPTPLSNARAPGIGTFRLRIEDIRAGDGLVVVSVSVTPVLAHLLLAHQKTASSASVCVPASLVSTIASRSRGTASSTSSATNPAFSGASVAAVSVQKRSSSDVDPFLDFVRVLLPKSDMVLRVDGVRYADVEFQSCLNQPIVVRGLLRDHVYSICLTICGMRSEELLVCLPSVSIGAVAVKEQMTKRAEIEMLLGSLEEYRSKIQAVLQLFRKTKKDGSKQLQNCENDLAIARKSLEKLVLEGPKLERRLAQLTENLSELDAEIPGLQQQLDEIRQELMQMNLVAADVDSETTTHSDTGSATRAKVPRPLKKFASTGNATTTAGSLPGLSGFGVLPILGDSGEAQSRSKIPVDMQSEQIPKTQGSALDRALKQLRATETKYRRAQDEREEVIQELKAERAKWMGTLAQVTQSMEPIERSIDPVRRDLKDVTKRANAGKVLESKLAKQLEKQTSLSIPRFEEKSELDKKVSALKKAIKDEEDKVYALMQRNFYTKK
ncbi:hypothetical protein J3B02_003483 [Coemansia erecta]|nr:hypothetical protein J3B02_003483 [Coemansia erecta]